MGKCGPEKTLYLDTFDAVVITNFVGLFVYRFLKNAHQKQFFFTVTSFRYFNGFHVFMKWAN